MNSFGTDIAVQVGVNAALTAGYLHSLMTESGLSADACVRRGRKWLRCSARMITAEMPYLSRGMVYSALRRLKKKGYISIDHLSEDPFGHTNWYAFTDYGLRMMEREKYDEKEERDEG